MPARALIALLLSLALACSPGQDSAEEARSRFELAIAKGDVAEALEALEELKTALPDTPETSVELAHGFVRAGKASQAVWLLESAVERYPEEPSLRIALAEAAGIVGDPELTLRAVAEMPMDAPRSFYALILRGRAQLQLGRLREGLATMEAAEARFPEHFFQIRSARVQPLIDEQSYDEALELVDEAMLHPDLSKEQLSALGLMRADILISSEEHEAALEALAERISEHPLDNEAWSRRVGLLIELERASDARTELKAALEESPEHYALYSLLFSAEQSLGNPDAAEAALRDLIERDPDPNHLVMLAEFLHQRGRSGEGAALLGEALERTGDEGGSELEYLRVALLISAGEDEAAREQFAEFRRRRPGDPRVEYLQARLELAGGDPDAAVERLKKVASRLDRSDVQHWLGVAHEQQGDYAAAEYRFALATKRDQFQTNSYLGLVRTFERRAMWSSVLFYANVVANQAPEDPAGYYHATRAILAMGRFRMAEQAARRYQELFPDEPEPALALSQALRGQNRAAEALVAVDAALELHPSDPGLIAEHAMCLGLLGRGAEGLRALDRAALEHPAASVLPRARAYLLFLSDRRQEAQEQVERALELDPDEPAPLRMAGDFFSERGDFAAAIPAYERYLKQLPQDATVLFHLAIAYDRAGDSEAAIATYRLAAGKETHTVGAYNNLALVLQRSGRLAEALEAAQQAYAHAPDNPMVMDTLGWLYVLNGKPRRGVALLEKAAGEGPQNAEIRLHLALAYRDAGETEEARTRLERLRDELDPGSPYRASVGEALAALQ